MKNQIKEIRVWEENGEVRTREIINESIDDIDMSPHPTECKIIVLEDDVKTIYSQEIEKAGGLEGNFAVELAMIRFGKYMDLIDNEYNNTSSR